MQGLSFDHYARGPCRRSTCLCPDLAHESHPCTCTCSHAQRLCAASVFQCHQRQWRCLHFRTYSNPFATASANAAGLAFANAFSFSTAQQLGLGKIMHAMGGATAGVPSAPVPVTTTPATAAPSTPTIAGPRHPNEGVPAASGVINSTIAENVMNALSNSNSAGSVPSEEKMRRVLQVIETSLE